MKKAIILFTFIYCANSFAKELLKVGVISYPPYIVVSEDKHFQGVLIEKFNRLFSNKFEIQYLEIPISRAEDDILSKKIDTHLTLYKTEEREKTFDFATYPILETKPYICGKKEIIHGFGITSLVIPNEKNILLSLKDYAVNEFVKIPYTEDYISRAIKTLELNRAEYAYFPHLEEVPSSLICTRATVKNVALYLAFKKGSTLVKSVNTAMEKKKRTK